KDVLHMLGVSVMFVAVINLALLPPLGVTGASLTTLLPELFFFTILQRNLKQKFPRLSLWPMAVKFLLPTLSIAALTLYATHAGFVLRAIMTPAMYGAGLYALKLFRPQELSFLKKPAPGGDMELKHA